MTLGSTIFISAASRELKTARQLVANTLQFLGYEPVWQDIFATGQGDLREMLRQQIDTCKGVVQLVGFRYGAEPPTPDKQFGRVSYTQYEALYAKSRGIKVWYMLLDDTFPSDSHEVEPPELQELQASYRRRLTADSELFHPLTSSDALESRVLKLRDELVELRRGVKLWGVGVLGLLLAILGIIFWLVRSQHLNTVTLEQVKERPLPPVVQAINLEGALATADIGALRNAKASPSQLATTLAKKLEGSDHSVARSFFQNSRNSPEALQWLKDALRDGLDPNTLITGSYYGKHGMLMDALDSGNAPAALAMLEAGASPHQYQDLWLTVYSIPEFLFPYNDLATNSQLSKEEKQQIARAFQSSGAVITRKVPIMVKIPKYYQEEVTDQSEAVDKILGDQGKQLGFNLEETPPSYAVPPWATHVKGMDLKTFLRQMPKEFEADRSPGKPQLTYVLWVEIRNLINVTDGKAYLLALVQNMDDFSPKYCLVEVSRDGTGWNVYCHTGPEAELGLCKSPDDHDPTPPEDCWRRYEFSYDSAKQQMMLFNYYPYKVTTQIP
jgi:hypothetical protein